MPNFANITLIGHLGKDPETRHTASGQSVTGFSLATSRKRKDEESTTWWRCSCWGNRGEALAQYLVKGDPVLIVGEPYQREWTDQSGQTRVSMEVDVRDWSFVSSKGERAAAPTARPTAQGAQPTATPQPTAAPQAEFDQDLPF